VAVRVIVPATLPVWSARPAGSPTCVELAGTVKSTVRPLVENWIAGSSAGVEESAANESVSLPFSGTGNALSSVSETGICCIEGAVAGTPEKRTPGVPSTATLSVNTWESLVLLASFIRIVKLKLPVAEGMPLRVPLAVSSEIPGGSEPPSRVQR
jgi:hypothetical protein